MGRRCSCAYDESGGVATLTIAPIVIIDLPSTLLIKVIIADMLKRGELIVKLTIRGKEYMATVKG